MGVLKRGFKSWAERTSLSLREEMDLSPSEPCDPINLAIFLEVTVWTPHDVPGLPESVLNHLLERDPWGWSAVTLLLPSGRALVIYNPRKSKDRQASDITHELAHFILDHKPGTIVLSPDGAIAMRTFDATQEEESNWLAGCILLPRGALLKTRRAGLTIGEIALRYGVSESLVTYRVNMTGIEAQLKRKW
jgi:IrrE N-terminal-like domain